MPPRLVNLEIKQLTKKAIAKPIITTPYNGKPSLWKSYKITSRDEATFTGISTDDSHNKFDTEEIGVIKSTVNKAADKIAIGYLANFIFS